MFMKVKCPACTHQWSVPESTLGQQMRCPGCSSALQCGTVSPPSLMIRIVAAPTTRACPIDSLRTSGFGPARAEHPLSLPGVPQIVAVPGQLGRPEGPLPPIAGNDCDSASRSPDRASEQSPALAGSPRGCRSCRSARSPGWLSGMRAGHHRTAEHSHLSRLWVALLLRPMFPSALPPCPLVQSPLIHLLLSWSLPMIVNLTCPTCGHHYRLAQEPTGRESRCPACRNSVPFAAPPVPSILSRPVPEPVACRIEQFWPNPKR